jgi:hypothetical protein
MLKTYFERSAYYPEIYRNPNQALQRPAFKAFGSILGGSSQPPRPFETGRHTRRLRRITFGRGSTNIVPLPSLTCFRLHVYNPKEKDEPLS